LVLGHPQISRNRFPGFCSNSGVVQHASWPCALGIGTVLSNVGRTGEVHPPFSGSANQTQNILERDA